MRENKQSLIRLKQSNAVKATGARFKECREMCNMSLSYAAKKLGYTNPSKLSKIENATDTNSVPLWVITEAAKLYEVSIDFLMGESDDWEYSARKTQEREVSRFQAEQIERAIRATTNMNRAFNDELEWASESISAMITSAEEIAATLKDVVNLNPCLWQEMRAGNKLVCVVERLSLLSIGAKEGGNRFKRKLKMTGSILNQRGLFDGS